MSSKLEQLAAAVRAMGAKNGATRRSLAAAQRDARDLAAAVPREGAGANVAGLLAHAGKKAQHAEQQLRLFSESAQAFADNLAAGNGRSSSSRLQTAARWTFTALDVAGLVMDGVKMIPLPPTYSPGAAEPPAIVRDAGIPSLVDKSVNDLGNYLNLRQDETTERTLRTIADGAPQQTISLDLRPRRGRRHGR